MKRFMALAGIAAAALTVSGCAAQMYGGGDWNGPYAYDGWYDGSYGNIYDGYWGDDGAFYYRNGPGDHQYHRGDQAHFARGSAPGANYQHLQGTIPQHPRGVAMPHFSGGGGGHGGERH